MSFSEFNSSPVGVPGVCLPPGVVPQGYAEWQPEGHAGYANWQPEQEEGHGGYAEWQPQEHVAEQLQCLQYTEVEPQEDAAPAVAEQLQILQYTEVDSYAESQKSARQDFEYESLSPYYGYRRAFPSAIPPLSDCVSGGFVDSDDEDEASEGIDECAVVVSPGTHEDEASEGIDECAVVVSPPGTPVQPPASPTQLELGSPPMVGMSMTSFSMPRLILSPPGHARLSGLSLPTTLHAGGRGSPRLLPQEGIDETQLDVADDEDSSPRQRRRVAVLLSEIGAEEEIRTPRRSSCTNRYFELEAKLEVAVSDTEIQSAQSGCTAGNRARRSA